MEPNKFERHIKEQMQKREIQPSAGAWEKVSERLEPLNGGKNNKFLWYAVAASFIGIMMISILFFQSDDLSAETETQIVDSNKEEIPKAKVELNAQKEKVISEAQNFATDHSGDSSKETIVLKETSAMKVTEIRNPDSNRIVLNSVAVQKIGLNEFPEVTDNSIALKIKEVIAQVDLLEQNKETITDAEVDSLLREAQGQLLTERNFKNNGSVDAMALLTEVEEELDQSLRDKLFERLKTGFVKVRTAVADRDY